MEHLQAAQRLREDLFRAGVAAAPAERTVRRYLTALAVGSQAAWRAFYASVHHRLRELAAAGSSVAAAPAALLALLDDDLGATLVSSRERARIRAALVEDGVHEASLSS